MQRKTKYFIFTALVILVMVALVGCGSGQAKEEGKTSATNDTKPPVSLIDQVKGTSHYGFFKSMAEAKEGEGYPPARADACIACHSAVKIVDDPKAKFADFKAGGKYAGKLEGITCRVCHVMTGDKMIGLRNEGVEACGVCHTGDVTEGKEVHHPQVEMFKGVAGVGVSEKPSRKLTQKFACYDCHFTNQVDHDFKAPTASEIVANAECKGCHGDAAKLEASMKEIKEKIEGQLATLKTRVEAAEKAIEAAKKAKKDVAAAEKAFGAALTNYTYAEADKSKGIHNPELAEELLKAATAKMDEYDKVAPK